MPLEAFECFLNTAEMKVKQTCILEIPNQSHLGGSQALCLREILEYPANARHTSTTRAYSVRDYRRGSGEPANHMGSDKDRTVCLSGVKRTSAKEHRK